MSFKQKKIQATAGQNVYRALHNPFFQDFSASTSRLKLYKQANCVSPQKPMIAQNNGVIFRFFA